MSRDSRWQYGDDMPNLALLYKNEIKGLTVTANAEDSAFPASNASDHRLGLQWHTPASDTDDFLSVDFGVDTSVAGFAVLGTNLLSTGTIQFLHDDDSLFLSPIVNSGNLSLDNTWALPFIWEPVGGRNYAWIPASSNSERYIRFHFINTGAADVRCGVIWAGPRWTPVNNYDVLSPGHKTERGQTRRTMTLTWNWLTLAEAAQLADIAREGSKISRVVAVPQDDVEESFLSEVMLCTISDWAFKSTSSPNVYRSGSITLMEVDY